MKLLTYTLNDLPEFKQLLSAIDGGACPAAVSGLAAVHRAHFAAALGLVTGRPTVVVCADEGEAGRMARDLSALTEVQVPMLTPRSYIFHTGATVSRQWEHRRLTLLDQLGRGEVPFLVATAEALVQYTIPPQTLSRARLELKPGASYDLNTLTEQLADMGYTRCDQVELSLIHI